MSLMDNLFLGLSVAFGAENLLYCLAGVTLGTLVGILPGLGPVPTMAMLLPITFGMEPTAALIMLAGIFYGAQYGGSTTAILLNIPGEPSSVVTAIEGHQMAKKGRAGAALASAAIGSFCAGILATALLVMFAPPLANVALRFGAPDYFSLMVLGLVAAIVLATGSALKAVAMAIVGLLIGLVGQDIQTGMPRLTFGVPRLEDGLDFVAIAVGIFGLSEIVRNLAEGAGSGKSVQRVSGLAIGWRELREIAAPILRGTALGSILGLLPGGGPALAAFSSYALERKVAAKPESFGHGAIAGVAGPESANNAAAQTSFIPMLTLGLPSNAVMALMMGAMIIQGIAPGPNVIDDKPDLFWGLIMSMLIGNVLLLVLNLPLIRLWVKFLTFPYKYLVPVILTLCCVGVYSINNNVFDLHMMIVFTVVGYFLVHFGCEPAPLLLGYIIGPRLEEHFRRAMLIADGDPSIFVTRPISLGLLIAVAVLLAIIVLPSFRSSREQVFRE